eukprot:11486776-Heterocapsa_arctica.AAC.1
MSSARRFNVPYWSAKLYRNVSAVQPLADVRVVKAVLADVRHAIGLEQVVAQIARIDQADMRELYDALLPGIAVRAEHCADDGAD